MSITNERKQELIQDFKKNSEDTGSSEVQIAILTERINNLAEHMKGNKKDFHSRYGLTRLVARRRSLLNYLSKTNRESYQELLQRLKLRK